MKKILITMLLAISSSVFAGTCTIKDSWTGPDKTKHFAAGAIIGGAGTLVFKDPDYGFALGAGIGVLKEIYDKQHSNHTCSFQDFGVTMLGAGVGAYGTYWIITPKFVGFAKAI